MAEWVEQNRESLIDRIRAWSEINSGSSNLSGLERMASVLEEEVRSLGVTVERIPLPEHEEILDDGRTVRHATGPALRAVNRPEARKRVLLNGHFDTVFGRDHPFQRCTRNGNRLQGPGVADMKGGLMVMLAALHQFETHPESNNLGWEILLTPDEELGSPSSAALLADTAATGRHCAGLIFEPALPGGTLASERMGSANLVIFIRGRSAHAGRDFANGRNAIVAMAELVPRLHALNRQLPDVVVNVGRIAGGGPLNMVPGLACCRLNVRATNEQNLEAIDSRIRALVTEGSAGEGFSGEVRGGMIRPSKPLTPEVSGLLNKLRVCAREGGFELSWEGTGGGSDGNNLLAAGLPTVDNLGVRGGGIHSEEEFLELDSLVERAKLCSRFLLELARESS